jgi:hypothetical protein
MAFIAAGRARSLLPLLLASIFALAQPAGADTGRPVPAALLALSQPAGQQRLFESTYRQPYWLLTNYFETQVNQAYCSVASAVIGLNALGVARPVTSQYPDYPFFTQAGFFDQVDPNSLDVGAVARTGLTMEQLAAVLGTHPVTVQRKYASDMRIDEFRTVLKENLRAEGRVLLLNFDRKEVLEQGNGHWSPIAAYHAASDSVLVLDVARYKYPPLWMPLAEAYAGARSVDSASGRSRGLLLLERK